MTPVCSDKNGHRKMQVNAFDQRRWKGGDGNSGAREVSLRGGPGVTADSAQAKQIDEEGNNLDLSATTSFSQVAAPGIVVLHCSRTIVVSQSAVVGGIIDAADGCITGNEIADLLMQASMTVTAKRSTMGEGQLQERGVVGGPVSGKRL